MDIEMPGAQTPWVDINHLLLLDERFEMRQDTWQGYLFAPKHLSRLAALMYLLKERRLDFEIRGKNSSRAYPTVQILISMRAFKSIKFDDQTIEVEAGCGLKTLQAALFEKRLELGLQEQTEGSIGGTIMRGTTHHALEERLVGVELMKFDGGVLKWHQHGLGPALYPLVWGAGNLPAILLKCYFRGAFIPTSRLHLTWTFHHQQELWDLLQSLKAFTSSWEKLDCILSGRPHERAFILAQISGTEREMQAFKKNCPYVDQARMEQAESKIKQFFLRENYHFVPICLKEMAHDLTKSTYIWYHALEDQCWLVTKEAFTQETFRCTKPAIWKEKLYTCL